MHQKLQLFPNLLQWKGLLEPLIFACLAQPDRSPNSIPKSSNFFSLFRYSTLPILASGSHFRRVPDLSSETN
jgi:hypothetical protein